MKRLQIMGGSLVAAALLACQLTNLLPSTAPTPTSTVRPRATATVVARAVEPPTQPPAPTASPVPQPVNATIKDNLRVRAAPNTSAAIVDRLNKGDTVQILGRTAASDWYLIALPKDSKQQGWISAEFASPSGSVDAVPVTQPGQAPNPVPPTTKPYP